MTPDTIISKRLIKDHVLAHRFEPHTVEITKPMIKSFSAACQQYDIHMEEEKKLKEKNDAERRAQLIDVDIEKLRMKQKNIAKAIELASSVWSLPKRRMT